MLTCSHGKNVFQHCEECREEKEKSRHDERVEDVRRCMSNHMAHCRATGRYTNDHHCFSNR